MKRCGKVLLLLSAVSAATAYVAINYNKERNDKQEKDTPQVINYIRECGSIVKEDGNIQRYLISDYIDSIKYIGLFGSDFVSEVTLMSGIKANVFSCDELLRFEVGDIVDVYVTLWKDNIVSSRVIL